MPTHSVTVPAFAKINLTLNVLWRRGDGFHDIASLFQTIDLADRLTLNVEPSKSTVIVVESSVPITGENIAARAARCVLEHLGAQASIHISIEKEIPLGGGLGGSSTDGAAVLLALPTLLGEAIAMDELQKLGASLSSDVNLFLHGGLMEAVGRGDLVTALPDLPEWEGLLLVPDFAVTSGEAYQALALPMQIELTPSAQAAIIGRFRGLKATLASGEALQQWSGLCENDFESVVFRQHPTLNRLRERLVDTGAVMARMSGSGSCLFALYSDRAQALKARSQLEADSGHVTAGQGRIIPFRTLSRRQYERAWQDGLSSYADGVSWPPRPRCLGDSR